ncbi:hypothetical protein FS837_010478 [Tulasnella sp. UAMH 9824]|nr:hypothetical protein FS837_010478 [Tulasnella sp. UAMH 9824]
MPKAEPTSRSSSPVKGSPNKRSYRVALPSMVNIPYGVPLSKVKVASHWTARQNEERPKRKPPLFVSSIPNPDLPSGIFLSSDIFHEAERTEVETSAPDYTDPDTTFPHPPDPTDEDVPNFNMDDLKDALDDSALCSGLDELPELNQANEGAEPQGADDQFLRIKQLHFARFLSGDGNFKLQRVARKRTALETPAHHRSMLGDAGFWVSDDTLSKYMSNAGRSSDEEASHLKRNGCNTMAGDPGYAPAGTRVLDVTGVFSVSCRHILICPNGVVDFQKGERYRPVDTCFSGPLNASYQSGIRYFVVTYDIACKYSVNFKKRCCDPSCNFVLIPTGEGEMHIAFCVNKFHQESHDDNCGAKNSLNYTSYVGRTCGEGVETIWAKLNWLRSSTREMNPGMRIEVLSEHFNDWNWQKVLGIAKKYTSSVMSLHIAKQQLEELKSFLSEEEVSHLQAQYKLLGGEKFYEDPTKLTWLSRMELLAETDKLGSKTALHSTAARYADVDHVDFICKALQLESKQAKLLQRQHDLARIRDPIPALKARISTLRQELEDGLAVHYELLCSVTPQLADLGLSPGSPESDEICLPSRFSPEEIEKYGLKELLNVEVQIRTGFAYDALHEFRQGLCLRSFWSRHVTSQLQSQTKKTKGQASLQAANATVKDATRSYNVCWRWLTKIAPQRAEKFGLRKLNESDILLLSDWQEGKMYKRSDKRLPWFWTLRPQVSTTPIDEEDQPEKNEPSSKLEQVLEAWRSECLYRKLQTRCVEILTKGYQSVVRLDFVHSTASVERWVEEVSLLGREMAATCRAFQHRAMLWSQRASYALKTYSTQGLPWEEQPQKVRGYIAYTSRQFDLYTWLAGSAYTEFEATVGEKNWADIWTAPITVNKEQ